MLTTQTNMFNDISLRNLLETSKKELKEMKTQKKQLHCFFNAILAQENPDPFLKRLGDQYVLNLKEVNVQSALVMNIFIQAVKKKGASSLTLLCSNDFEKSANTLLWKMIFSQFKERDLGCYIQVDDKKALPVESFFQGVGKKRKEPCEIDDEDENSFEGETLQAALEHLQYEKENKDFATGYVFFLKALPRSPKNQVLKKWILDDIDLKEGRYKAKKRKNNSKSTQFLRDYKEKIAQPNQTTELTKIQACLNVLKDMKLFYEIHIFNLDKPLDYREEDGVLKASEENFYTNCQGLTGAAVRRLYLFKEDREGVYSKIDNSGWAAGFLPS